MKLLDFIKRFFFPDKCIFCQRWLRGENDLLMCDKCADGILLARGRGKVLLKGHISYSYAPFGYCGGARKAILALKFSDKVCYADTLSAFMAAYTEKNLKPEDIDMIVPVPLSKKRFLKRGYNQSYLLAKGISERLGLTLDDTLLKRVRDTAQQSKIKSYRDRALNVRDAFYSTRELSGESILLIDDIYTSGATCDNCAKALKVAGAGKIYVCTAANKNLNHKMQKFPVIKSGKNIKIKT